MSNPARYTRYGSWLKKRFGKTVRKISVDAGFTCPNLDGSKGLGGCTFCSNTSFSPAIHLPILARKRQAADNPQKLAPIPSARDKTIGEQLTEGIRAVSYRYPDCLAIAYLQSFTNTYAPVEKLREIYLEALAVDRVVGISIGTRPDCVSDEVVDLLEELARTTYLQLELGLQTANNQTLTRINRLDTVEEFQRVMQLTQGRGIDRCAHLIIGLPGETMVDWLHTAEMIAASGAEGIKIHNLHIVKGTVLAQEHRAQAIPLPTLAEYVSAVADIIERLPVGMKIERLYGNAPDDWLIAPDWCAEGVRVIRAIEDELARRGTRQGAGSS